MHNSADSATPSDETTAEPEMPVYTIAPLTNYTLSRVCPSCGEDMFRLACKVRCLRCGFMWDCSEL